MDNYSNLVDACIACIDAWKEENGGLPLEIEWGDHITHCYQYGGKEVQSLYDACFPTEENRQPELRKLERTLLDRNLGPVIGERVYFGCRISELRHERGMTQRELADLTGIKREHISRLEAGKYSVGLDILTKVAKALGTEIDFM